MLARGDRLGPYEIVSPLGAGGMGEVYRAHDTRLGRDVALKVLPEALASHPDRLKRFEREAHATAALSHPNVIAVFDVGSDRGRTYVVSELLEGAALGARLRQGKVPTSEALSIAAQAARGLAAAHAGGIVHRDVKPDNLFLTRSGTVKVLDFGLARLSTDTSGDTHATTASDLTAAGAVLGTASYMSPEQAKGLSVDTRSDLFSLGVVLYEMLSGVHPFRRASSAETLSAILRDEPSFEGTLPPAADRVVRRCLEKDPEQRFQSALDLEFALTTLSGATVPAARLAGAGARMHRWWFAAAIAFAVLALPGMGFLVGQRIERRPAPSLQRLTYRRGNVWGARFSSDGRTVVYSASWDGQPGRLFTTRIGSRESSPMDLPDADILAISKSDEMAILLKLPHPRSPDGSVGTLALVPMAGGAPREVLEDVLGADFSPDGRELAVVRQAGGQRRLEYPVGKVLLEAPRDSLGAPRVSPNGELVAVDDDHGAIHVVDRRGKVTTLKPAGGSPVWSPTGDEIWARATNEAGTDDSIIATTLSGRRRVLASQAGATFPLDAAGDGRLLMSTGDLRAGITALAPGDTHERDLSWLSLSNAVDLSPDGRLLLFNEGGMGGFGTRRIYLRRTDGSSPAVRLGEGHALSLSPDGRWALTTKTWPVAAELVVVPTGAGETRVLKAEGLEYLWASFFPDGKRVLAVARQAGRPWRTYIQDVTGGPPRPFLPEDASGGPISPDGRLVAALDDTTRKIWLWPTDGGPRRAVPGPAETATLWAWSTDARFIYCVDGDGLVLRVFRRDVASGRRELLREVSPSDPAGIFGVGPIVPAADGKAYAYSYWRALGNLYLVEGLR